MIQQKKNKLGQKSNFTKNLKFGKKNLIQQKNKLGQKANFT